MRRLQLYALVALCVAAAACRSSEREGTIQGEPVQDSPAFQRVRDFAARLSAMRTVALSTATLTETPCPDDRIKKRLGSGGGRLLAAEARSLARFGGPEIEAAPEQRWQFLTTSALRAVQAPKEIAGRVAAIEAADRIRQIEEGYRHLAIFVTIERRAPSLEGSRFLAGTFSGWVVIFDLGTKEKLCAAHVEAQSSEEVAALPATRKEEALWNDYALRVRQALDNVVGRITRHLVLDLD